MRLLGLDVMVGVLVGLKQLACFVIIEGGVVDVVDRLVLVPDDVGGFLCFIGEAVIG